MWPSVGTAEGLAPILLCDNCEVVAVAWQNPSDSLGGQLFPICTISTLSYYSTYPESYFLTNSLLEAEYLHALGTEEDVSCLGSYFGLAKSQENDTVPDIGFNC